MKRKQTEKGRIRLSENYYIVPIEHGYGVAKLSGAKKRNYDFEFYDFDLQMAVKHFLEKLALEEVANGEEMTLAECADKLSCVFETTLARFMELIEREKRECTDERKK